MTLFLPPIWKHLVEVASLAWKLSVQWRSIDERQEGVRRSSLFVGNLLQPVMRGRAGG